MKNKFKMVFFGVVFAIPQIVCAAEYIVCGNDHYIPLAFANIFSLFVTIIRIVVPILLVITGMISFFKVIMSGNTDDELKKAQKKLINNVIAAVIIFFVISIVNFVVALTAGRDSSAIQCLGCLVKPGKCNIVDNKEKICPGLIGQEYDENCNVINDPYQKEKEEDINKDNYIDSNTTNPSTTPSTTPGTTPVISDPIAESCCASAGGGTYNNGTCENVSNAQAYTECVNDGGADIDNSDTEAETDENIEEKTDCCSLAGGTYDNGVCNGVINQNSYDACLNTVLPKTNESVNVLREACCLRANGYFEDNKCEKYEVQSNAYSACVGTSKKKTVKEKCCKQAHGKFENNQCKSVFFDEDIYNRCK